MGTCRFSLLSQIGKYEGVTVEEQPAKQFVNSDDVERAQKEKRLQNASLDELEELEDDEDEAVLAKYRELRLQELKAQAARARQGSALREIGKAQWKDEVSEAAFAQTVVVLLFKPGDEWCALLERQLAAVAARFPRTKFVKIVSTAAVPDFPDASLPCLLVYNKAEPIQQIVGLPYGGGAKMTADDVEWALHVRGVIKSEMEENPRSGGGGGGGGDEFGVRYNYVGGAHLEDYND